jgi:lipopolysaccharide/colanic/teichoic acid biosynthesis glycosyltransferase
MKRAFDVLIAFVGLVCLSPLLLVVLFLVWQQDKHSPLYFATRVGRGGSVFSMMKIRSMVVNADKTGVESTGASDPRITAIGRFIRQYKIDEVGQLWNVLKGDMSLVGPRPNTQAAVKNYTLAQKRLLDVRPGITDFSSIVFSDEGEIIKDYIDADSAYNRLIWPHKSKLGLIYAQHASVLLDLKLIWLTIIAIRHKKAALVVLHELLLQYTSDETLIRACQRSASLDEFV